MNGNTPLHLDSDKLNIDSLKMVNILLDSGTDINFRNSEGYAPLMYAVKIENFNVAEYLIKKDLIYK